MNNLPVPPQAMFNTQGGKIAVQAGELNNHGILNISLHDVKSHVLGRLPYVAQAAFNSYDKQHEPTCLPGTRVDVLQKIEEWADGNDERCIFWLSGLAGTGKSTIARTVARIYSEKKHLGASFFFSKGGGDVSNAKKFIATIAFQLAQNVPDLCQHICGALTKCSDIASQSLSNQWHQLVLGPLAKLHRSDDYRSSYILIVDALDECDDDNNIQIIIQLLAEARALEMVRLRVFLTSRPEMPIRYRIGRIPDAEHQDFVLHNISPSIVDRDISTYLTQSLQLIAQDRCLAADWPGKEVVTRLVRNASGLFIWAATAYRFIRDGKKFTIKRLHTILEGSSSTVTAPEKHLNEIYITILKQSVSNYTDEEKEEFCVSLRHTLGSVALLLSPLSAYSLSRLLHLPKDEIDQTMEDLHAILDISQNQHYPLRLHHPSFRDFLLSKDRCTDSNFWVDEKKAHWKLAENCIQLMSASLKQDICGVDSPGELVHDVESSRVEQCLPPEIQYACLYWMQHLQKSSIQLYDNDQIHNFLKIHFLHWLEALSWMRKISEGIYAIDSLESIALTSECLDLCAFIYDMRRFVLYSRPAIEQAPLQVYCSAIVFAPMMSMVKRQFIDRVPQWMKRLPEVEKDWNALLQTLEGHRGRVLAVAFSPDGKTVASCDDGSYANGTYYGDGGIVKLWDAATGVLQQTLKGHRGQVLAVAFSPDGKIVASCDNGGTVKLWDVATGALQQTLKGHRGRVLAAAFSSDGNIITSCNNGTGYNSGTVKLWDAATGALQQALKDPRDLVNTVVFSPDGKMVATWDKNYRYSLHDVGTVELWDAATGALQQTLKGHQASVKAVVFSPDSKMVASCDNGSRVGTVKLWDVATGALQQTLEGHRGQVLGAAFSPDGKIVASCDSGNYLSDYSGGSGTVKLWDIATGALQQTLKGHRGRVLAVAFSPDSKMVVSCDDGGRHHSGTVKLWVVAIGAPQQMLEGHQSRVLGVTFSPDGNIVASYDSGCYVSNNYFDSNIGTSSTVKLWDTATGALQQTLKGHRGQVLAVVFSPDGKMVASCDDGSHGKGNSGGTVKLWDAATGALQQTLEGHRGPVLAVTFSPDGKRVTSCGERDYGSYSKGDIVKLWDAATGALQRTFRDEALLQTILLSEKEKFLQINRRVLKTTISFGNSLSQSNSSHGVSVGVRWVYWDREGMLWLPAEYRPCCSAIYGSVIALGYPSGRLLILEFDF